MRLSILLFVLLAMPAICFAQTTWYVPDDFPTIQGAISSPPVLNGDTVIVRPGTYVENIDFLGKAITVKSEYGPEITLIDGGQPGNPDYGSVVSFNNAEGLNSILEGFTLMNGTGTIGSLNKKFGGGIYCKDSSPKIIRNNITGNNVSSTGGGISCDNASPWIIANIICDNVAADTAGGIRCIYNSNAVITNNIIYRNKANWGTGGGIHCRSSNLIITNNTVYDNYAKNYGGGISCIEDAEPLIMNTIVWNNDAANNNEIYYDGSCNPTVIYCDVEGGHVGKGNIDADPRFSDSNISDFHLLYDSLCINRGDNSAPGLPEKDFEGDPRIAFRSIVDIGADEFYKHIYYTGDATSGGVIQIKCIGIPGTLINGLILGVNIFDPPLPCDYGLWYMDNPFQIMTGFGAIPADGVKVFPGTIPGSTPAPMTIYLQAAIDSWLTNLCTVNVQ